MSLAGKVDHFFTKRVVSEKRDAREKRDVANIHSDLATKVIYVFGIQFITSVRGEEKRVRNEQRKKWNKV